MGLEVEGWVMSYHVFESTFITLLGQGGDGKYDPLPDTIEKANRLANLESSLW
jgi:hypothetical protein